MNLNMEKTGKDLLEHCLAELKQHENAIIEKALNEGIEKGIISVRTGGIQLYIVNEPFADKTTIKLANSAVIEYQGAEKIEALEQALAYQKKINGELHNALEAFYQQTKPNTYLKRGAMDGERKEGSGESS